MVLANTTQPRKSDEEIFRKHGELMGTPLPPNEPGDLCLTCWGPGKVFGDIETPKYAWMTVTNVSPGENWNPALEALLLTPHMLIQQIFPCNYALNDGHFAWLWQFLPLSSQGVVNHIASGTKAFFRQEGPRCLTELQDLSNAPENIYSFGGNGVLTFERPV